MSSLIDIYGRPLPNTPPRALGTSGTQTLDFNYAHFSIAPAGSTPLATSNAYAMGIVDLDILSGGTYINWPAAWQWATGMAPTLQADGVDRIRITAFVYASTLKIRAEVVFSWKNSFGIDENTLLMIGFNNLPLTDLSANGAVVTNANITIDTTNNPFGTGSGLFNGSNARASVPVIAAYTHGTGAFTHEGWLRTTAAQTAICSFRGPLDGIWVGAGNGGTGVNGQLRMYTNGYHAWSADTLVNDGNWHHFAWTRTGGYSYLWLNGVQQSSWADTTNYGAPGEIWIGYYTNYSTYLTGNLKCYRVSNIARYTGAGPFTPPANGFF